MGALKHVPLRRVLACVALACAVCFGSGGFYGCHDHTSGVDENKLCREQTTGFGARIVGLPETLDMCVSDDSTVVDYIHLPSGDTKYLIAADFENDSLSIQIQIGFFLQGTYPVDLRMTADRDSADADPGMAWFYYREAKLGAYDYVDSTVTGNFNLAFNDTMFVVGSFAGVGLTLDGIPGVRLAAVRGISEGYVSVGRKEE